MVLCGMTHSVAEPLRYCLNGTVTAVRAPARSPLSPKAIAANQGFPGFDLSVPMFTQGACTCPPFRPVVRESCGSPAESGECLRVLTDMRCKNDAALSKASICDSVNDAHAVNNGVSKRFHFMACGKKPAATCAAYRISSDKTMLAPFMCLEMTPDDAPQNKLCTCWARTGGVAVSSTPRPRYPDDRCNPLGEYIRSDKDTVTPLTQKCCPGLLFGCLDSNGGISCDNPAGTTLTKFCYDPNDPIWPVGMPSPLFPTRPSLA